MIYKVVCLVAVVAVVAAQSGQDHGHGHAYSSQSIVIHHTHHETPKHHETTHTQQSSGLGGGSSYHESHGHQEYHKATSSQQISRHDVPSKAPADHHEYYSHPKYEFEYKVEDPHTKDIKAQHESRDGDVVKGYYSLHEPDGTLRIVHYSADKKSGFNAQVERKGHAVHQYHHHH